MPNRLTSEEMSDQSISIRLPEELLAEIDAQAQLTQTSRTETIVKMLQQALDRIPNDGNPVDRILFRVEALEQKVADLVDRWEGEVLEDLKSRLTALEREQERIVVTPIVNPAETDPGSQTTSDSEIENSIAEEWMTVKEAFAWLGGDPQDPSSGVTSLDGRRSVSFNRFRVLKAPDYKAFGLEFQSDGRRRQMPCLRPWK
jgi:Ribbon-helix-helix protein, copG family